MAFSDAIIDERVKMVSDATEKANLKTHINTLHTNLTTVVVTNVGKTATDAEFVDIEDKLLELCEQVAVAIADYTA